MPVCMAGRTPPVELSYSISNPPAPHRFKTPPKGLQKLVDAALYLALLGENKSHTNKRWLPIARGNARLVAVSPRVCSCIAYVSDILTPIAPDHLPCACFLPVKSRSWPAWGYCIRRWIRALQTLRQSRYGYWGGGAIPAVFREGSKNKTTPFCMSCSLERLVHWFLGCNIVYSVRVKCAAGQRQVSPHAPPPKFVTYHGMQTSGRIQGVTDAGNV